MDMGGETERSGGGPWSTAFYIEAFDGIVRRLLAISDIISRLRRFSWWKTTVATEKESARFRPDGTLREALLKYTFLSFRS